MVEKTHLEVRGYKVSGDLMGDESFAIPFQEYMERQRKWQRILARDFVIPFIKQCSVETILDVGCGSGFMVKAFMDMGYKVFGVDLLCNVAVWENNAMPRENFFIVNPESFILPFKDGDLDFVYSLGVIEHVGTTNGHSDRKYDYHEIRRQWLREVFRVVRPCGSFLVGGPNRNFPLDTYRSDIRASKIEKWLFRKCRVSIHKTWGENFRGFRDFDKYLEGLSYELKAVRMSNYYKEMKKIPQIMRPAFKFYLDCLPEAALKSFLNPWAIVLIKKV